MSEPLCQCGHGPRQHAALRWECYDCINLDLTNPCSDFTPRPDPAPPPARSRDDAEEAYKQPAADGWDECVTFIERMESTTGDLAYAVSRARRFNPHRSKDVR